MTRTWIAAILLLAGCAGTGGGDAVVQVYDLGIDPPKAALRGLRPLPVRAPAPFDTSEMLYRLAYRNPAELMAFSQSRWAATPAVLLQRRFSRAVTDGRARCAFEFELSELTQVFSSKEASDVLLEGRATLFAGTQRLEERVFRIREGNAGGAAATGARSVALATDRLIGELAVWASSVGPCSPG